MIEFINITKSSEENVILLDNVSFSVEKGEILAIIGHNGSGKSTLLKSITGYDLPVNGKVLLNNNEITFDSIYDAKIKGFELLQQQPTIFPYLSIIENMFCGVEPYVNFLGLKFIDKKSMFQKGKQLINEFGITINDLKRPINTLSGGQIAIVTFIRTLQKFPVLLALDEPTAALGPKEKIEINNFIEKIAKKGVSIIFVTHSMRDVITLAHKVLILKEGKLIYFNKTDNLTEKDLLSYML